MQNILELPVCTGPLCKRLRNELFTHISESLRTDNWKDLGRKLLSGDKRADQILNSIDREERQCIDKYRKLLEEWHRMRPEQVTIKNLYRALKKTNIRRYGDDMFPIIDDHCGGNFLNHEDTDENETTASDGSCSEDELTNVSKQGSGGHNQNDMSSSAYKRSTKNNHRKDKKQEHPGNSQKLLSSMGIVNGNKFMLNSNHVPLLSNSTGEREPSDLDTSQQAGHESVQDGIISRVLRMIPSRFYQLVGILVVALPLLILAYGMEGFKEFLSGVSDAIRSLSDPRNLGFLFGRLAFWA